MATLLQKYRLLKGLCTGDRAHTGPFYLTLDLTRRCNLHCLGCRFHSQEVSRPSSGDQDIKDFPIEWAEALFSEIAAMDTRKLFLVGDGEPFLYPHIFDIFRLAKKHGLRTTVTTNGTLIDKTKAGKIIDSGLDEIHVSLWASSYETYAKQYPGTDPVNFHRVIDGLKTLSQLKSKAGLHTPRVVLLNPTNRFNYKDVDKMAVIARETGCNAVSYTPFKTLKGELEHHGLTAEQQLDLRNRLIRLKKTIKQFSLGQDLERFMARSGFDRINPKLPCYTCWFHSRIKVDGTVVSCGRSELPLGSLKTDSFTDIWNGDAYRSERRMRLSPEGHKHINAIADCEVCGFVRDNWAIHRRVRYLLPLRKFFSQKN